MVSLILILSKMTTHFLLVFTPFTRTIPRHGQDKALAGKLLSEIDDFASKCDHVVHKVIERNYVFTETKRGTTDDLRMVRKCNAISGSSG